MKDSVTHSSRFADSPSASSADAVGNSEALLVSDSANEPGIPLPPVVGLGGSAGSLEGLQRFFRQVPADSGMAFAVVVHLSSQHESMMAEIFQRTTTMPVSQVTEPVKILPNHVYVIPPGMQLSTSRGMLNPSRMPPHKGRHITVDLFFRMLAKSHGRAATAIVLSGGDGDGALGLKHIKEHGGLTIAQDPAEAEQPSMPLAAIETGMVDWILPVDQMPARLIEYQDLLISVTHFFRDREAFEALAAGLPKLFENKGAGDSVRVWVPGCATGEEAFSIAMLLNEHAATLEGPPMIQIFATDLDQAAIAVARDGRYPMSIEADVSEKRLRQFFTKEADGYRVKRPLREMVLFATHNLLKDSPFSRLDLVTCRNLLIYLNRKTQLEVFDVFHFALRPDGRLFLGSSETADDVANLFRPIDKEFRIYARQPVRRVGLALPSGASTLSHTVSTPPYPQVTFPRAFGGLAAADAPILKGDPGARRGWGELHLKLIERIAPPSLVIGLDHRILHLSSGVGRYLQFGGGELSTDLLRVIHPQLRTRLRAALFRASRSKETVEVHAIPWEMAGVTKLINLSVVPADDLGLDYLLVVFEEKDAAHADPAAGLVRELLPDPQLVEHLEDELDQMKAGWRETVEQYESSLEELSASNEELQAMNEELRSATEELETGREELQSINEEIVTINQELKSNVEELRESNGDLQNLMACSQIATIFLDRKLRIKRFTSPATDLFHFISSDVGRPFSDLSQRFDYPAITRDTQEVLERDCFLEREVRNLDGRWFLARMFPYRNAAGDNAGVVITCVDITERKASERSMRLLSSMVESANDGIISFTMEGEIVSWNRGAERIFGYTAEEIIGHPMSILSSADKLVEKVQLFEITRRGQAVDQFETACVRKDGQRIDTSISSSIIDNEAGEFKGVMAIVQDITIRKKALSDLQQVTEDLENRVRMRTVELHTQVGQLARMASELTQAEHRERKRMAHVLHDQLQQILVAAKMRIESIGTPDSDQWISEVGEVVALLDEALANSRSLAVELSPPILAEGLARALEWLAVTWAKDKYGLKVSLSLDQTIDASQEDIRNLLFLTVKELLFNVVKHSSTKEASVELAARDTGCLRIVVRDAGQGFDTAKVGTSLDSGSGFGLHSLNERLLLLGGSLEIHSSPGCGVEAIILAPMKSVNQTHSHETNLSGR